MNTNPTLVYRLENSDKIGPYNASDAPILRVDWDRHPLIQDSGIEVEEYHVFGFPTMEALHNWFDHDMLVTISNSEESEWFINTYEILSYRVESTHEQCIFDPDYAELVHTEILSI